MKRLLSVILSVLFLFSNVGYITSSTSIDLSIEAEIIAQNTPGLFGYHQDWIVAQNTPLHDENDQLIAFCIDLIDSDDRSLTSYAIISSQPNEHPVLMYGYDGTSSFLGQEFDKAYYFGGYKFFLEREGFLVDQYLKHRVPKHDVRVTSRPDNDDFNESTVEHQALRVQLAEGSLSTLALPPEIPEVRQLTNVPNLQWRKGCAPTSVAMMIKTRIPGLIGNTLIDNLASAMGTKADGSTSFAGIVSGTRNFFDQRPFYTSPKVCNWNTPQSDGRPVFGSQANGKYAFRSSIVGGFPVGVYLGSSTITTPTYDDGFGAHLMCGFGYSFYIDDDYIYGSSRDYVVCYTTSTRDGAIHFPLTSSALKNRAWFMLKW